jgi:outer membrane biosynthesis protein TonB
MWMFIGLLSLVGIFVFIILAIVHKFKKNGNAKKMMIGSGVCFVLLIAAVSLDTSGGATETASTVTENKNEDSVKGEKEEAVKQEAEKKEQEEKAAKEAEAAKKAEQEAKEKAAAEAKAKAEAEAKAKEESVPREYKSALTKAESYAKSMHMSKAGIYEQLTSEYGENFPPEAAQYAIDNIVFDWKENALKKAQSYAEKMNMSNSAIYDQLISEYGEKFTPEEAQYAIDNLE